MGCTRRLCTAEKIFIFINIAFAMYSGALLATSARLAWDPSTYAWFRFLCVAQYRVSAAYTAAAGAWLAALVYLAAAAASSARHAAARSALHAYALGVAVLAISELCYGAWMGVSLSAWWRDAPEAALARKGMDMLHDIKPALLAMERHRDLVRPIYDMLEEVEHKAPNNAYVIIVFGLVGMVLQVAAFVMALRVARRAAPAPPSAKPLTGAGMGKARECAAAGVGAVPVSAPSDDDSDAADSCHHPPGWRKKANLQMYTILDKIF